MPLTLLRHAVQKPPPGIIKLDPEHPQSQGLIYLPLINEGGGPAYNLLNLAEKFSLTGAAAWASGQRGRALITPSSGYLSGTSQAVGNAIAANTYSLILGLQNDQTGSSSFIGSFTTTSNNGIIYGFNANQYEAFFNNGGWRNTIATMAANDHALHYIGVTMDNTANTARLYMDGALNFNSTASPAGGAGLATIYLGTKAGADNFFNGHFSYFAFYNRALTTTEMANYVAEPWGMLQTKPLQRWFVFANTPTFTTRGPNSATTLPSNHNGNITLTLVGTGTSWTSSTTFTPSGVSGWAFVSKVFTDTTHYTVTLSCPAVASPPAGATGTLTLTEGVTGTATSTIAVNTPTLSVAPSSATPSAGATALTFTGTNTLWQGDNPQVTATGVAGTTIGASTATTNTASSATLTVGATTGTVTLTDVSTGATASFTIATGPPPTPGTLSLGALSATQVNLSSTAITGGTGPYSSQLYRSATDGFVPPGAGTAIGSPVVGASPTFVDPSPPAGVSFYVYRVTDNAGGIANSNEQAGALNQPPIVIGGIGDSIMNGNTLGAGLDPLSQLVLLLGRQPNGARTVTASNHGISGTVSTDWVTTASGQPYDNAKIAFVAAGVTHILIHLGANDAKIASPTPAASYKTNISGVITHLKADFPGVKILLCAPLYIVPGSGSGVWTNPNNLLASYGAQLAALADNITVFMGDQQAYTYFAAHPSEQSDGVHPTATGAASLADFWAVAFDAAFLGNGPVAGLRRTVMTGGIVG